MFNPAFVVMTMASHPSPPSSTKPSTNSRPSASAKNPPKRVRNASLSQKYRPTLTFDDESQLISDQTPFSESNFQSPIRFSRFPASWPEAILQVNSAVTNAVAQGHDRIRIDVKHPELISNPSPPPAGEPGSHRLALLVEAACATIQEVMQLDHKESRNYGLDYKVRRASLHFNSAKDADIARALIPSRLASSIELHVLGDPLGKAAKVHISVVIAPSNRSRNPEHIENVESVHYSYWSHPKIIVMLNPDLIALTNFASFNQGPRQPGFLQDYMSSYYIDPVAFPSKTATGALLRCFPRKWELYLLKLKEDMGFRLIAEQQMPPSAEKLRNEFSWRVEQDVTTALSV